MMTGGKFGKFLIAVDIDKSANERSITIMDENNVIQAVVSARMDWPEEALMKAAYMLIESVLGVV